MSSTPEIPLRGSLLAKFSTSGRLGRIKKAYGWVAWSPEQHPTACPLCLQDFVPGSKNSWACWDHCHSCGHFRGWICSLCNSAEPWRHRKVAGRGIQHLIRDPEWQARLSEYLDSHACKPRIVFEEPDLEEFGAYVGYFHASPTSGRRKYSKMPSERGKTLYQKFQEEQLGRSA